VPESGPDKCRKPKKRSSAFLFLRDAGVALTVVVLILVTMYAYTGLWPPLVVIESDSMMHGDDNISHIGTIDTGDLVLVREVTRVSDIETYMEGFVSGHRTYGDYGDVVIYKPDGADARTPIIHRAIIYLDYDSANHCFVAEALKDLEEGEKWAASASGDSWSCLTSTLRIFHVGWDDLTVTIDVSNLLPSHTSGFVTKGDGNANTDLMLNRNSLVELDWVVGKARGEIPWFGLLKLWTTDSLGSAAPENSVRNLWISIILIVVTPVMIDIGMTYREKRAIARESAERSGHASADQEVGQTEEGLRVEEGTAGGDTEEPPKRLT